MGDLFEYMVGSFYNKLGVSYIEMNKLIPNDRGTQNEIDVLVCKDNKVIIIECKATKSSLSLNMSKNGYLKLYQHLGNGYKTLTLKEHMSFKSGH